MSNQNNGNANDANDANIVIPDEFLTYNDQGFTKVNKKDGSYKKSAAKSAFVITINPNISHRTLTDINDRKRIFIQLTKISNELEANFRAGRLLKEKPKVSYVDGKPPTLDKYKCVPEIGKQNGFIHLQGVVSFNGTTMIDTDAAREMVRKSPNGFGNTRECKIQFKWFSPSNEETMLKYIDKDYEPNNAAPNNAASNNAAPNNAAPNSNQQAEMHFRNTSDAENNNAANSNAANSNAANRQNQSDTPNAAANSNPPNNNIRNNAQTILAKRNAGNNSERTPKKRNEISFRNVAAR